MKYTAKHIASLTRAIENERIPKPYRRSIHYLIRYILHAQQQTEHALNEISLQTPNIAAAFLRSIDE